MKKIIISGLLLLLTLSIFPMQQSARKLAPFITKNLTGGQKRHITEYLPELSQAAQAAIIFTGLNIANVYTMLNGKLNHNRALTNNILEAFKDKKGYTFDFDKETQKFKSIKKDRIPATEKAFLSAFFSILIAGSTGSVAGIDALFCSETSNIPFAIFYLGHAGLSILSLNAVVELQKETADLKELALKEIEKAYFEELTLKERAKQDKHLKKIFQEALSEGAAKEKSSNPDLNLLDEIQDLKKLILEKTAKENKEQEDKQLKEAPLKAFPQTTGERKVLQEIKVGGLKKW